MMRHKNCVPHYTVLWANGNVWRGVAPPCDASYAL
jgi:hypothetical protein